MNWTIIAFDPEFVSIVVVFNRRKVPGGSRTRGKTRYVNVSITI
jgi:hypothetical protein